MKFLQPPRSWSSWTALSLVNGPAVHKAAQYHYGSSLILPSPSSYIQMTIVSHGTNLLFPYILNLMARFHPCCFDAGSHYSTLHPWMVFLNASLCPVFIPSVLLHSSHKNSKGSSDHGAHMTVSISGSQPPKIFSKMLFQDLSLPFLLISFSCQFCQVSVVPPLKLQLY